MCVCSPSLNVSLLYPAQGVRSVLSRLLGRLRCVERGGGVHVSRAAPDHAVQPPGAVPKPGLSLAVSALHAAGHQHCGHLWQVETDRNMTVDAREHVWNMSASFSKFFLWKLCSQSESRQKLHGSAGVHHTGPRGSRLILWVHTFECLTKLNTLLKHRLLNVTTFISLKE